MAKAIDTPRRILITGASSGIGEALARAYAGPETFLALSGRDRDRLDAVAEACREHGAEIDARVIDVTDGAAMDAWISGLDDRHALDLVIANAGIAAGTRSPDGDRERAFAIFAVNLNGVLNTVLPIIPRMRARRSGQIALMSSVAGFLGIPGAPAYAASKAAVKAYAEGLRGWLAADGVRVSSICPGFVVSRMTASNAFPMPFLMEADAAARIIQRGLARNRPCIVFPLPTALFMRLMALLPSALSDPLLTRLPKKE